MKGCLNPNNPNLDIFKIPTQEGADEDDQWNGSIGDAVSAHVYSLSHSERQLWEDMICTRDGNIFRVSNNIEPYDKDPFHLQGKDLDDYLNQYKDKVSSESLQAIKEAIDQENENRTKTEDALDMGELVPYSEWERFPQMWNSIDIPNTPKDKMVYCGNTRQQFYDVFPEGHQDALFINKILGYLNGRKPENLDENYGKWLKTFIKSQALVNPVKPYVIYHLQRLVDSVIADSEYADQYVLGALKCIDGCWSQEFKNVTRQRFVNDSIYRLLLLRYKEWKHRHDNGESVYSDIKTFGQIMFNDLMLRQKMTNWHWAKYKKIKSFFAPKVIVRGKDINRCSMQELSEALRCDETKARKVWLERPFENIGEVYSNKLIDKTTFGGDENLDKVVNWLERITNQALKSKSLELLNEARKKLMTAQMDVRVMFTDEDWGMLWSFHRICRQEVMDKINEKGK